MRIEKRSLAEYTRLSAMLTSLLDDGYKVSCYVSMGTPMCLITRELEGEAPLSAMATGQDGLEAFERAAWRLFECLKGGDHGGAEDGDDGNR